MSSLTSVWKLLGCTLAICSFSEGILYLLVYRTEDYQRKIAHFHDLHRKLEKERNAIVTYDRRRAQERKISNLEESVKAASADMNLAKMKVNLAISALYFLFYRFLNALFQRQVMARLPFVPIKWLWGMTHRNLEGDDYRDCSFVFLYTLASMFLKAILSKAMGTAPPRTSLDIFQEAATAANKKEEE
ncbi:hypothetical protein GAYE_SCF05G2583 [Galdieria yellowstonensis]|uniref:CLAC channel n=1 Tax=Galdieria yellowstonensis TaxID=3028027 RepID=A0AAV9IB71_9RHOD|nr:hypothetical protein GAYE_SCF05G2583 [Galdieria yellowstonensis]